MTMNNDNGFYKLLSKYNVLDDIVQLKADTDMLKYVTTQLDTAISVDSPRHTSYELEKLHSDISKIFNDIIEINTQLDELYSDIQHIKDILNI